MCNFVNLNRILNSLTLDCVIPAISVSVILQGKVVYSESFGKIIENGKNIDSSFQFDIASLTKIFTITCFMMLVENNKIRLSDRICEYYTSYNCMKNIEKDGVIIGQCDASRITWKDVLTHTAGFGWTKEKTRPSLPTLDQGLEVIYNLPFKYNIGEKIVYSDIPIILVGNVMERIYGKRLDEIVNDSIITPLGLQHTNYRRISKKINNTKTIPTEFDLVFRKKRIWGEVHDENAYLLDGVSAHSGIFSNSIDVCKLMAILNGCLISDGIVKRETAKTMIKEYVNNGEEARGIMWLLNKNDIYASPLSSNSYGHSGFTGCFAWNDPDKMLSIVLLSNDIYNGREKRKLRNYRREIIKAILLDIGL